MKKLLLLFILTLSVLNFTTMNKAQALLSGGGTTFLATYLKVAGILAVTGGTAFTGLGIVQRLDSNADSSQMAHVRYNIVQGIMATLIGLVFLKNDGSLGLNKLNLELKTRYNLNNDEFNAWNGNVAEIKNIFDAVTDAVQDNPTMENIEHQLGKYKTIIPRDAYQAIQKIRKHNLNMSNIK